jgi:hypothetical protein
VSAGQGSIIAGREKLDDSNERRRNCAMEYEWDEAKSQRNFRNARRRL